MNESGGWDDAPRSLVAVYTRLLTCNAPLLPRVRRHRRQVYLPFVNVHPPQLTGPPRGGVEAGRGG